MTLRLAAHDGYPAGPDRGIPPVVRAHLFAISMALLVGCGPPPPRPAIVSGHVVAQPAFRAPILLIDTRTGKATTKLPADGWVDAPPSAKGLFYAHGDGGLVARDGATGAARWRVFAKVSYYFSPVVSDPAVFVFDASAEDHAWRGYDAMSGAKTFDVPCDYYAPLAAGGGILATIEDGKLVVRNAADGKQRYRVEAEAEPPILISGERFFAKHDGSLGVFRSENGRLERSIDVGSEALHTLAGVTPALATTTDLVVFVRDDEVLVADASNGKTRWKAPVPDAESLVISRDIVVVAADEQVVGFDISTGKKRWSAAMDPGATGLSAQDGLVAVRAGEKQIVVLEGESGKRLFSHDM